MYSPAIEGDPIIAFSGSSKILFFQTIFPLLELTLKVDHCY